MHERTMFCRVRRSLLAAGIAAVAAAVCAGPEREEAGGLRLAPAPCSKVRLVRGLFKERFDTDRETTIWTCLKKCEETRIGNFENAARNLRGEPCGQFRGDPFDDSDVYKVMEGAAYLLAAQRDQRLQDCLDGLIAKVVAAQEPDGYLYTARTIAAPKPAPQFRAHTVRWLNECGLPTGGCDSHELYNVGHMYEAAVAHFQSTGSRALLDAAVRNANLVCSVFGPGEGQLKIPPGHQEIELALVKLYRATGDRKYLDQAKFFLDCRGRGQGVTRDYYANHKPVTGQDEAVGHSVRTTYMLSGMTDVAGLFRDDAYRAAVDRLWGDIVGTKYYLTGGIGAEGGHEGFGVAYLLPNATAYNETCASIAMVLWNHRMFLLHEESRYLDVLERTLYNGVLSGLSLEGDRFFYPNPLSSRGRTSRSPWFDCACCPVNLVRTLASVSGYAYATAPGKVYAALFMDSDARLDLGGKTVSLRQETDYPWSGKVRWTVGPGEPLPFELLIRIPGWARGLPVPAGLYRYVNGQAGHVQLTVNGAPQLLCMSRGFASLQRVWKSGDVVELDLDAQVRRVSADVRVKADVDRVAFEYGPVVFCAEGVDNGGNLKNVYVPEGAPATAAYSNELLKGVMFIKSEAVRVAWDEAGVSRESPDVVTLVPYYAWSNRKPGAMDVWLPACAKLIPKPAPGPLPPARGNTVPALK